MIDAPTRRTLDWRLAWGVVALQGALQLGWMVYRAYQPTLLGSFGFGSWVFAFSLLPGLLGLGIEPLAGALNDQLRGEGRGRVLQISLAVLVAGMLFLTIVGLAGSALPRGWLLLPALMLAWQIAVQLAASPNLALLRESAPLQALPRVAALSVLVQGVIGALESPLTQGALRAGPALTFILAAGVLMLALAVLRAAVPLASETSRTLSSVEVPASPNPAGGRVAALLLLALVAGLAGALARGLVSPRLPGGLEGPALFNLGAALGAPWAGRTVARVGAGRALPAALALALGTSALALVLPPFLSTLSVAAQGMAWGGGVATTLTALALGWLPPAHGGLAAGLLLAGTGLAGTLRPLIAPEDSSTTTTLGWLALSAALALGWFRLVERGSSPGTCRRSAPR